MMHFDPVKDATATQTKGSQDPPSSESARVVAADSHRSAPTITPLTDYPPAQPSWYTYQFGLQRGQSLPPVAPRSGPCEAVIGPGRVCGLSSERDFSDLTALVSLCAEHTRQSAPYDQLLAGHDPYRRGLGREEQLRHARDSLATDRLSEDRAGAGKNPRTGDQEKLDTGASAGRWTFVNETFPGTASDVPDGAVSETAAYGGQDTSGPTATTQGRKFVWHEFVYPTEGPADATVFKHVTASQFQNVQNTRLTERHGSGAPSAGPPPSLINFGSGEVTDLPYAQDNLYPIEITVWPRRSCAYTTQMRKRCTQPKITGSEWCRFHTGSPKVAEQVILGQDPDRLWDHLPPNTKATLHATYMAELLSRSGIDTRTTTTTDNSAEGQHLHKGHSTEL